MYDVLGNLVKITQGDQQRYFKYDSLSRLIRERQVEQSVNSSYNLSDSLTGNSSWSRKFEYNSHGLLTHGYDARGIQTDFYYDDLNRTKLYWACGLLAYALLPQLTVRPLLRGLSMGSADPEPALPTPDVAYVRGDHTRLQTYVYPNAQGPV